MQPEVFTRELERDVCKTTWRELEMMKVTAYKKKKEKSERISGQNHQESFKSKGNSDHIPKASRQLGGIAPSKTLQSSLPAEEMNYMGDRENGANQLSRSLLRSTVTIETQDLQSKWKFWRDLKALAACIKYEWDAVCLKQEAPGLV